MNKHNVAAIFALSLLTLGCSFPEIDNSLELRSGDRLSMDFSVALGEQAYDPEATSTIELIIGEEAVLPVTDPYQVTVRPMLDPEDPQTVLLHVQPTGVESINEWTPHVERRAYRSHEKRELLSKDFSFSATLHWP